MYGLTRATLTLIGAAAAGALLWLATTALPANVSDALLGGYWAAFGLVALGGSRTVPAARWLDEVGLAPGLEPRVPGRVPADARRRRLDAGRARAGELLARAARSQLVGRHRDRRPGQRASVHAFGDRVRIGLVFGLTFDTTGPRIPRKFKPVPAAGAQPRPGPAADGNGRPEEDPPQVRLGGEEASEAPPTTEPVEPVQK